MKYLASPRYAAVSAISSSDIVGPRMWNTVKVIWIFFFAASIKPMSRSALSVGSIRPARTSISVTDASAELSVSKTFIWSATSVMSTTSVRLGWKRLSAPRGVSCRRREWRSGGR